MSATAGKPDVVDVIIRDGRTVRLRPMGERDGDALLAFYAHLSDDSSYMRFHGARRIDRALVDHLLSDTDGERHGGLVAVVAGSLSERVVGVGEYARLRDATAAEVAFAVADELQGHGLGTRLLEQLAAMARSVGVERFVADVLPSNHAMLEVFADAGFAVTRRLDAGEVEVSFAIAPTGDFLRRVDERDHFAVDASLRPVLSPAAVAVIGASPRRGSIGDELFRNILAAGFRGAAYPVNRTGEAVAGIPAYRAMADIPEPVDLAVVCVPAERVLDVAAEALAAGTRGLCVISSGFAETGRKGAERQERLLALVRAYGGRLVGPNCLGVAIPGIGLNATFAPRALPPGGIAFSSQSGALGLALLEKALERGLGFSSFVSVGNKADVSPNDLLEWWEDDDETALILLYLESFGNPRKFGRLAPRVARRKPILALKAGTTGAGARAAGSHTAALASSETAVDALFRHAGVLRARTLEELVDAAVLLSHQPLPHGKRTGIVTNAGGLGILCADACESSGLELAQIGEETRSRLRAVLPGEAGLGNPVDLLGTATAETYEAVLPVIFSDPSIDSLIVLFVPPVVARADDVAAAVVRVAATTTKPVLAVVISSDGIPEALRAPGGAVPAFAYPESAARALAVAVQRAEWLRRQAGSVRAFEGIDAGRAREIIKDAGPGWLDPAARTALLEAYGIPLVPEIVAGTADEAVAAAAHLGFPVAIKRAAPAEHKTERGGVVLGLERESDVRAAATRLGPPVLVQAMITGAVELLAGVVQDPVFGPLVGFGPGGVMAELIGGARFAAAPLTDVDALELVHQGKAGRLVAGFRGHGPADGAALADLLERLACLAEAHPEVAELDLNPVLGLATGCLAVDARVRLARSSVDRRVKTW